jgi:hypothetical protein
MKTQKISFKNIKDVLSRAEMKNIMAGSGLESCGACFNGGYGSYCLKGGNLSGCTCMSWPGMSCMA